jgi:formate dehydrogenase subunit delta
LKLSPRRVSRRRPTRDQWIDRPMTSPEVRMGNQIALEFAHRPAAEAAAAVARHIENFWDPSMRRNLDAVVAAGDDDLHPLLVDAVRRLAAYPVRSEAEAQP